MNENRRKFLTSALTGMGALGLRSLATGLPMSMLANPLEARAQARSPSAGVLILNTSFAGEPLNCNAPGMYGPGMDFVVHPTRGADMTPTDFQLGGQTHRAARPWADLGESIHQRLACLHHATYTGVHARQGQVMRLMGNTRRSEMFPSIIAKATAPELGTVQAEPVSIGANPAELISFDGRTLANVAPTSLKQILGGAEGPLGALQSIRDRDLDRIHDIYRASGSREQRRMLDRFARSRTEARSISNTLVQRLESISDDEAVRGDNQIIAAPVLAAMNVTPVITIHVHFGGDNHFDEGLTEEANAHRTGFAQLAQLVSTLDAMRTDGALRVPVSIATLGVFGRTFGQSSGRAHNSSHHVTMLISDSVRPGVYGGCEPRGAQHIDAASGAGLPGRPEGSGIIPFGESLQTAAKTIGAAVGVARDVLEADMIGGQVLEPMLR